MPTQRFSRQRKAILDELRTRKDHPTAETLYRGLRHTHPTISLGTVYRNLTLLEDQKEVIRIPTGDGPDRFDGDLTEHHHLKCRACGSVEDVFVKEIVSLHRAQSTANASGAQIEGVHVLFYGLCGKCAAKQKVAEASIQ